MAYFDKTEYGKYMSIQNVSASGDPADAPEGGVYLYASGTAADPAEAHLWLYNQGGEPIDLAAGNSLAIADDNGNSDSFNLSSGTLTFSEGDGIDVTVSDDAVTFALDLTEVIADDGANRVLTSDGDGTLSAEAGMTYNGTQLSVVGGISGSQSILGHELDIESDADIDGMLNVQGDAIFQADLTANSGSFTSGLYSHGATQLRGDVRLEGALTMDNASISDAGSFSGVDIDGSGDLTVATITMAEFTVAANGNTDIDGTLDVEGAVSLQSTLGISGDLTAASASFSTIYGSGDAQIVGALRLEGALTMDNASISDAGSFSGVDIDGSGDLTVATITMAEFTVASNGNTDIDGTLDVEGAANLQSTIAVAGAADLNGALDVAGAVDLAASGVETDIRGTLSVDEAAVFDSTVQIVGNADLDGQLDVAGAANFQAAMTAQSASFTTVYGSGAAQFASSMKIEGAADLDSTLDVEGAANFQAAMTAQSASFTTVYGSGDAQFASAMKIEGAADLDSTLDVEGAANFQAAMTVAGAADLNGALDVAGAVDLAASGVLTNVRGTLSVDEAAVFDSSVQIDGALTLGEAEDQILFPAADGSIESSADLKFVAGQGLKVNANISGSANVLIGGALVLGQYANGAGIVNESSQGVMSITGQDAYFAADLNVTTDLSVSGDSVLVGDLTVGQDGAVDIARFHGDTSGTKMEYSADMLKFSTSGQANHIKIGGDASSDFAVDVANVAGNGGKVRAAAFVTYSDESLKSDVEVMNTALDAVMALNGVEFTWKDSGERDFGFIAQEVAQVLPKAVHTAANGISGVDYSRLTSVLVEAVKAQQVQIEELKAILKK